MAWPVIAIGAAWPWGWLALVGPAFMALLLIKGSGVPPLEAAMVRSRGEAYRAYQRRVSVFVPLPPRKDAA
jgi:steroid 5-alpha reductase family enzyme